VSISNFLEDTLLNLVFNGTAYGGQSTVYVKLHVGDPGEAGTANPASETTRAAATFGTASGGAISNDAPIQWTNLAASETITHISLWDASTGGNCLWAGPLTASKAVNAGDNLTIPTGDLDVTLD
jgi:hypothetical protein